MTKTSKIRLQDIAEYANVSVATVSMALAGNPQVNDKTRRVVKEASRTLGYNKKPRLADDNGSPSGMQKRFGYLLVGNRLEDDSKMVLAHALAAEAAKNNLRFELSAIQDIDDEDKLIKEVIEYAGALDGVIMSLSRKSDQLLITELGEQKIPFVMIGHLPTSQEQTLPNNCELIAVSCFDMGKTATEYLLDKGHRRIGFISEYIPDGMVHDRWLEGYQIALLRRGISPDSSWVHVAGKVFSGGTPGANAMLALGDNRPTAYIIPDVRTAALFIQAMQNLNMELSTDCVVMGGEHDITRIYNVQQYPLISVNNATLAAVSFKRLRELCEWGSPCSTVTVIPFETYNMEAAKCQ